MSLWGQMGLQDPSTPIQMEMITFHDHAMVVLVGIFSLVLFFGIKFVSYSFSTRTLHEAQMLETVWTIVPAILLIFLALPSLRLLYLIDEKSTGLPLKVVGHQWYWSYGWGNFESFDSFMIKDEDLNVGDYRLLEVDNRVNTPLGCDINLVCTSADVLHSWALPAAGVKIDAVPGRLNTSGLYFNYSGVFYGQCSEICGANHSFMPIVMEVY
uniref:Cytochrome c oxidase subunit 2 n=1 Tax=Eleutherocaulis alte TaxID=74076 RepID=A0A1P7YWC3_9EUPU|nr:cytochrome c oxidase subunit II [Eleutherocaulis alte]AKM99598.1 cytochrome c oxidase subunit II [Eleutherocaulis alte]WDD39315.1 cytochrome c oxidase subunit 2 [Eleutherocaulis alte]